MATIAFVAKDQNELLAAAASLSELDMGMEFDSVILTLGWDPIGWNVPTFPVVKGKAWMPTFLDASELPSSNPQDEWYKQVEPDLYGILIQGPPGDPNRNPTSAYVGEKGVGLLEVGGQSAGAVVFTRSPQLGDWDEWMWKNQSPWPNTNFDVVMQDEPAALPAAPYQSVLFADAPFGATATPTILGPSHRIWQIHCDGDAMPAWMMVTFGRGCVYQTWLANASLLTENDKLRFKGGKTYNFVRTRALPTLERRRLTIISR